MFISCSASTFVTECTIPGLSGHDKVKIWLVSVVLLEYAILFINPGDGPCCRANDTRERQDDWTARGCRKLVTSDLASLGTEAIDLIGRSNLSHQLYDLMLDGCEMEFLCAGAEDVPPHILSILCPSKA